MSAEFRVFVAALFAAAFFPAAAIAEPLPAALGRVVAQDETARMEELAPGVYAIVHRNATDEWPHSNTGVIEGRNSLFVIDSTYLPSRARADIALIRQVTQKPVRYLVTTHWHMDHNFGASAYLEAFPDLTYMVERNTARWMVLNQVWYSRLSTSAMSARRASLAELEAQLARGTNDSGAPFSAEERAQRQEIIAERRNEQAELSALRVITPNRLVDGSMTLNFEGRRIEIHNWGRANSPSDTTYYLPREQILFAGDILVQSPLPYSSSSYPYDWATVLRQIEAIPAHAVVLGHGPVQRDQTYTSQLRTFVEGLVARVQAALAAGKTLDQAKAEIDLDDLRAGIPAWNTPAVSADDWTYTEGNFIERAWQNVRGQEQ